MKRCISLAGLSAIVMLNGVILGRAAEPAATVVPGTKPGEAAVPVAKMMVPPGAKILFDGQTLDGWVQIPADSWVVKDGAMASTGVGRGVIYTKDDFSRYRLMFTMRHVGVAEGQKDHAPCALIFCTRPTEGEKPPDALAGIQFQPPNGGHWDYRPGHNNAGNDEFTKVEHEKLDPQQWFRVELVVNSETGKARMAVAQPVGAKAVEVLKFDVPDAGKKGPIAWQIHNKGLLEEVKDVVIEENPASDELIMVK